MYKLIKTNGVIEYHTDFFDKCLKPGESLLSDVFITGADGIEYDNIEEAIAMSKLYICYYDENTEFYIDSNDTVQIRAINNFITS